MSRKREEIPVHIERAIKAELRRRIATHAAMLDRMIEETHAEQILGDRVHSDYPRLLENCLECEDPGECARLQENISENMEKIDAFCSNSYYFGRLSKF